MRNFTALISFVLLFPLLSYTQVSPEKKLKIDKLMESWGNSNSPGAAIGIIQNGELIFSEGYGMANLDYGIPINSDAKFYLASIAKQFTATSVALLAIEGKINLDDNIRDYFPEIPDYGHKITIRNLIHHTSGLRDYLSIMYLSGSSFEDYFNNEDGLKIIARQKALNFVPNQEYLYSNSNYILLAELVKRVSGMSIRAYADQHIFKPLGMKNTYFNDNHKQISGNRVVSYNKNEEGNYERYVQNFDGHGDGGMISTINDLYLWDQNFYHKRVGGQALQDIILSRQRLANGFLHAYSFGIEHGQYKGLKINMHGGNFLGFNHHFTRFSDNNFSVIVLANTSEVDPYFITDRISDLFLSDLYKNPEPSSKEEPSEPAAEYIISPEELSRYEGTYWNYDDNYSRKIYVLDDTLRYQRGPNNVSAFLPIAQDKFEMLGNSNVKLTFGIGDNTPNHLSVSVGESRFFNFTKYEPADYSLQELESFVGLYVSPELDCHYEIRRQEEQLVLFIKEKEISPLLPVMKDYFTNDMLGSISFNKMNRDEFVLKSGRVRGIIFTKKP